MMKKALTTLFIFFLLNNLSSAEDLMSEQKINNEQAYFTANLQKQPEKDSKQGLTNHFTFFTINVQINGKIKDSDSNK